MLFWLMDKLSPDKERRYWIHNRSAEVDIVGIGEESGQEGTGVNIASLVSDKTLSCNVVTTVEEYVQ